MAVKVAAGLDNKFGAGTGIGSVYDRAVQLAGNFDIWKDGYANTRYRDVVKPLSDDRDEWAEEAKLDWELLEAPCYFETGTGTKDELFHPFNDRKVLYRSDTLDPLAVVGNRYKPLQPAGVLDFFGDLTDQYGFTLELAGEALNGRRIFGLAKCPQEVELPGGDKIKNYLMLVTHNDGSGATRGFFTSIRPFCMNQMPMMLSNSKRTHGGAVARQSHSSEFDAQQMGVQLQAIDQHWEEFSQSLLEMRQQRVTEEVALQYMATIMDRLAPDGSMPDLKKLQEDRTLRKVMLTYQFGEGQEEISGTVYGLLNGVTRYLDHDSTARKVDALVDRNWLGAGRKIKEHAYNEALKLVN